ncbi:ATP-binding protein [Streptomyces sp. RerS4]|uniref:sensor histidine kinase n=1 Tax=Streptomyces sp. RerS4 TaxID=2942449 RepID=UPI00201B9E8B|nr:ATP-binding protein [Streptomyces sp. RerS4]UQW99517.1 ATP-binding protein [Streptomyces sp. RerS4]
MAQQESPPESARPRPGIDWTLPVIAVVAAACLAGALVSAAGEARTVWIAVGGACTAAALLEAVRRGRSAASRDAEIASYRHALLRQEQEVVRLAEVVLGEAIDRLRRGELPEEVLNSLGGRGGAGHRWGDDPAVTHRFRVALQGVLARVVDAVDNEEGLRDSAQRAFVNISRRVQAIVHQQAQELRDMEDRHGRNPAVFGDLLRLDHGTALVGRLADSISVLGGARPGRQWSRSVTLYSVLRGAMSRILDYQRVDLHSVAQVAVIGPLVEPLIHAIAELLDNATRYSPPHTRVHLTAVEVQSGIAVEIEDGGLGMSEEAHRRAERMLAQAQHGIDLNDIGETPRLGLAVVGRLAQSYALQVSLRSSAYGGVRAVVIVPQHLVTTAAAATGLAHGIGSSSGPRAAPAAREHPAERPAAAVVPRPAPAPRAGRDAADEEEEITSVVGITATGLPQRRRKSRAVSADAFPLDGPPASGTQKGPGMWLEAFHSGLSGASGQDGEDTGDTSGTAIKGT